jgi:hypothetical protein
MSYVKILYRLTIRKVGDKITIQSSRFWDVIENVLRISEIPLFM